VLSGCVIVCEQGYVHGNAGAPAVYDNDGKPLRQFSDERGMPQKSFINAVRSRNRADLRGEILDGHLSTTLCHMGNASFVCGESEPFDAARKTLAITSLPPARSSA
jgi:hypothetical protein